MILNEEFLALYEELSELNDIDEQTAIDEAFDNEEVHGEAAKTIPGLLRYFVAHIETLANVVERGRILASTGESKSSDTGTGKGKKLPFVSFSHQLFSHAYRRGSAWKYGVVVDQNKLEQKVRALQNAKIEDNFVHKNKSSRVFGAAKLADGAEVLITSYGSFEMNLSDAKRKALGELPKTDYYEKVKTSFNTRLAAEREKYADGHAKSITVNDFYCSDSVDFIKRYLKIDVDVIEGFLLVNRLQSTSIKFTDICKDVPGLFDYLQEYTTANEGELRVWLPKDQKYLDISGCIVGIVLPSNYKENNLDNPENTASDVVWLRKLIAEKNLTVYVYQSKDETNIPDLDYSRKLASTLEKPSIMEYFHKITSSREAVIDFIKNELTSYNLSSDNNYAATAYVLTVAKNTTCAQGDVRADSRYNYRAFLEAAREYNLTNKDITAIFTTGTPLQDAKEAFMEKVASAETVQLFLTQLHNDYPGKNTDRAYASWFVDNTNALYTSKGQAYLSPADVSWNSFANYCKQTFNYTPRDLFAISRGESIVDRLPIKDLFKKAASTNKKTTLTYIKNFAPCGATLAQAYSSYMGKYATDINSVTLQKNINFNYRAWLEKITDPNGPVKLTREEVLKYFKDFKAAAANNN